MTQVYLFITPTSVVKLTAKAGKFLPIVGPVITYTKKAQKMTQLSNPVTAASRGIGMIFDFCFGKAGKISAECVLWFGLSVAGGVTGNPVLIITGAQFGEMIVDDILE